MSVPLIVGSGRSGTTWVQDMLASANGYRTAFEPLHPAAAPDMKRNAGRYLRADEDCESLKNYLEEIFTGRSSSIWINYRVRPDRLRLAKHTVGNPRLAHEWLHRIVKLAKHYRRYSGDRNKPVLTKFIRANLMCDWLVANFDVRLLEIVRHPGAVIESKVRLGGEDWQPRETIDHYLRQPDLVDDHLACIDGMDIDELSLAGQHALIWCIENASHLRRAELIDSRMLVSYYENLLTDHDQEWQKVSSFLGFKNVPPMESRKIASQQARPERAAGTYTADELGQWRARLSAAATEEVQSVLDTFGIQIYRMDKALPNRM